MATFREMLQTDRPADVGPEYAGGCCGCPWDYGYEDDYPDFCTALSESQVTREVCTMCWNREAEPAQRRKVVYIAGPITGTTNYKGRFAEAEDKLEAAGFIVLNPTRLPAGLAWEQYMHIDKAMIDVADVVLFLPGWHKSKGAIEEMGYCKDIGKPNYISIEVLIMKERTI